MVEVPEAYRTLTGSTRSAAAMSWRRSEALVRASAYSTARRASVSSTSGNVVRASADATSGGPSGFGLPDSRDHLDVVLLITSPAVRPCQQRICSLPSSSLDGHYCPLGGGDSTGWVRGADASR